MTKKKTMSREEANALYDNLHKAMGSWMKQKKSGNAAAGVKLGGMSPSRNTAGSASRKVDPAELAAVISQGLREDVPEKTRPTKGAGIAIAAVVVFACLKVVFGIFEMVGLVNVENAQASIVPVARPAMSDLETITREEKQVLTALDARRVALEERSRRLDERESSLDRKDREFITRITELRDLTSRLRVDRDKNQRHRNDQLTQLSKVYSSMNPTEAAPLIEQLDVTIALALLERMSEKRVAQILALMNNDRALMITKMLSGGA